MRIGANCTIGASAVVDGWTDIGDETEIFPFASIGLIPQDLKFKGEPTRLSIGRRNIFREFVTINRGTRGGGGVTEIGDRNVFMAYVHVAHDCHVGHDTIFGPHATLGGHVTVEDFANISAGSAVHQFCRVGRHGFIGGYSVVTKDALPFARTVGSRPARIFGVNTIGLDAARPAARRHREAEAVVPLPAPVQAEHDEGAAADRAGSIAGVRRSRVPASTSSAPRSAASSSAARPGGPKKCWPMRSMRLGLIAGNGRFPFLVLEAARAAGPRRHRRRGEGRDVSRTDRRGEAHGQRIHWVSLGQLGTCISLLKRPASSHAVMAGQVKHTKIFSWASCPTGRWRRSWRS